MTSESKPYDPYDIPPPAWQKHTTALVAGAVFLFTALLTFVSFPPFSLPEFAYVFATPALLWAYRKPAFKLYAGVVLGANMLGWILVLNWLHHVSWVGMILLGAITGLWVGSWFLGAWWALPRIVSKGSLQRILCVFGLAAFWVVIEWTRTWFLSGFPWLTLATSQWQRVSVLQISAYTGSSGVSFVLIAANIAFAAYAHRLFFENKVGLNRRSQEFMAVLFLFVVCVTIHLQEVFNRGRFSVSLGTVALVQPNIPQEVKWDPTKAQSILETLEKSTLSAAHGWPDLIVLPEATTPWAVKGDAQVRQWTETLAKRAKKPLLFGSIAIENEGKPDEAWYNGAFVATPETGVGGVYYAKRHLVPFGEYIPLRPVLGWLRKVVPIGDDFTPGLLPQSLKIKIRDHEVPFGPLICYEDIFPSLAVDSVRSGAEVLVVITNDAWYKESGAAVQHAAHSVMRAVETRRPVLRCGNNGWSGWIDEYGTIRAVIADKDDSIFVRANGTVEVTRDFRWIGRKTFYVENGDWFLWVCVGLSALTYLMLRKSQETES